MWLRDHVRIAEAALSLHGGGEGRSVVDRIRSGTEYADVLTCTGRGKRNIQKATLDCIRHARSLFLRGLLDESAYYLGIAFHSISEATCPALVQTNDADIRAQVRRRHDAWLDNVASLTLPRAASSRFRTPRDMEKRLARLTQSNSPFSSLRTSVELCAAVLDITWRPATLQTEEDERIIGQANRSMPSNQVKSLVWACAGLAVCVDLIELAKIELWPSLALGAAVLWAGWGFIRSREKSKWVLEWYDLNSADTGDTGASGHVRTLQRLLGTRS